MFSPGDGSVVDPSIMYFGIQLDLKVLHTHGTHSQMISLFLGD